ncbi:MAG: efflux RND transporter periplasmic adaptor subunit [Rhodospirillales bacterium]|nr:efflux RND transporter periplasmic adaptor subunit [Rhodospirillales bacterium]
MRKAPAALLAALMLAAAGPPPDAAVPVTIGTVVARDLPILLRGIGTAQADATVTIRSRADGQILAAPFTEGQEVAAGTLLFRIDPRPYAASLAQAEAAKAKDEAQLAAATADLARFTSLLSRGFQSRQSYDQQRALVAQISAAIAGDRAAIETARINLSYTEIRAPIAGRLGAKLVDPGNIVRASDNTPLVTIARIRPIYVSFSLPQQDLDPIRRRQRIAPLAVEARSRDDLRALAHGTLTFIDNTIDPTTGTIHLKARFANARERLWPGEFVNLRVTLATREHIATVPAETVQQGPDGWFVYVVGANDIAHRRTVGVAAIQNGLAAIDKGLAPGERVVVRGQYRLTDGAKVAPLPAGAAG